MTATRGEISRGKADRAVSRSPTYMPCSSLIALPSDLALFGMLAHKSPRAAARSGMFLSVDVRGPTDPSSISFHVHGADTGAPGLARTVYAAANVAP